MYRLVRDYVSSLRAPPPRHWDFREWSPYVLMLHEKDPNIFPILSFLNRRTIGKIFIFIGKTAEQYAVIIDKTKHDVRDIEPYFFPEDNIKWKIK